MSHWFPFGDEYQSFITLLYNCYHDCVIILYHAFIRTKSRYLVVNLREHEVYEARQSDI